MELRDYQLDLDYEINKAWEAVKNVLAVAPTGAGKTVIIGNIVANHKGNTCVIAHRQELVSQISIALARDGVVHNVIGSKSLIYDIIQLHVDEFGRSFYSPDAKTAVAGVRTLLRRSEKLASWMRSVTLWVTDEAHHILKDNQWGKVCDLFPNAKGLGVTATPLRLDGAGLGRHADGVFDVMVEGPSMRDLINSIPRYLTDYRVFAPPSDLDLEGVNVSKTTGEYSPVQLKKRVEKSHIVGDVVKHYKRIAMGKLGITFATDVETATRLAAEYNEQGVPAEVVSAKTPVRERSKILRKFKNREILQLVNVDLFSEGFDLPAIEVVSMARPTQSYGMFVQAFGRALRILAGKDYAIIIDHVGNIMRHGLPDKPRIWSLDRREKFSRKKHDPDLIPMKTCKNPACYGTYEATYKQCPYCGMVDVPGERGTPEQVDGDLTELDPAVLAMMRGEVIDLDDDLDLTYMPHNPVIRMSLVKQHALKQQAQKELRDVIKLHGGHHQSLGIDQPESWKRFYFRFNIDIMSAQSLKTKDANELRKRIENYLGEIENV